ncbi:hypothetical protein MLD38_013220 [Melastoma candidum]|uniref:Uncharacterized protein n=1 Tax=Melastoma candidum TaxID=119954 RepID=A0ACB9RHC8_9MYRT|nr:hypothetical protein MLD38_013220 [Melastoma candidum]
MLSSSRALRPTHHRSLTMLLSSSNPAFLRTFRPTAPIGSCSVRLVYGFSRVSARRFAAAAVSSSSPAFEKIRVPNPVVEMTVRDEMARIMWKMIKDKLIFPFLELDIKYYDLGILNHDATEDAVTVESGEASLKYNVAVKCATITPDEARVKEFGLQAMWRSPNGTIRNILDGTVKATLVYVQDYGSKLTEFDVYHFKGPGVALAMYNTDKSIRSFAESSMSIAFEQKWPLYLSTKNTILKKYDGRFKDISKRFMRKSGRTSLKNTRYVKSEGGYVWACKNYDGDVQSDLLAQGFGSLGLMTSVLLKLFVVLQLAIILYIRRVKKLAQASIFAWTRGLEYRAKLDKNDKLLDFVRKLEAACIEMVETGKMTKDLAVVVHGPKVSREFYLNTEEFIDEVARHLESKLHAPQPP